MFKTPALSLTMLSLSLISIAFSVKDHAMASSTPLKEFILALKPDKNPDQMNKERSRLEQELQQVLKIPVKVMIPTSSSVILQGFANGTIDAGYLSSLDMVNAERIQAAELLLAGKIDGKTSYESLWLTKSNKNYKSIGDLKGSPIAFASRTSTSGYLIPYWNLIKDKKLEAKQDPSSFFGEGNVWYGSGYVSAVQRVLDGTAEAAAVSDYVFFGDKHLTAAQKAELKILQRQGPVPTHVIAIRRQLSAENKKIIKAALLKMNENPELRNQVFSSELVEVDPQKHLASTKEALALTGLVIETK